MTTTKLRTTIATLTATLALGAAVGPIGPTDASAAPAAPVVAGAQPSTEGGPVGEETARRGCVRVRGRIWCRIFPDKPIARTSLS